MKIYIVFGFTNDYGGHDEWLVCAYCDEIKADIHVRRVQELADKLCCEHECDWRENISDELRELDPLLNMDFGGILYRVIPVDVKDNLYCVRG